MLFSGAHLVRLYPLLNNYITFVIKLKFASIYGVSVKTSHKFLIPIITGLIVSNFIHVKNVSYYDYC